ncbi:MAG: hypothetical protein GY906_01075, partial [bacterium]|nr:hypothetical protein [bacterium]
PSPIGMKIKDHDLRQLNEERLQSLQEKDPAALLQLTNRLLDDLKEARERLNRNSSNSSCPSGSQPPWFRVGDEESAEDDEEKADDSSDSKPIESDSASSGKEESGSASSEKDESDGNEKPKKKTGKGRGSKPKNKPGKQPGAQGFGRTDELNVNETIHHYPDRCVICGDSLNPESAVAHTGFYTIELILGGPEKPGLTLWVTKHIYYGIACVCQHETKEMPYRAPEDEGDWNGVDLTEWRLAG